MNYVFCKIVTSSCIVVIEDRGMNKWGAGGRHAPPDFVRIEGAAGQRQRAELLLKSTKKIVVGIKSKTF